MQCRAAEIRRYAAETENIQGGYETGKSGSWAIAFPHALLGISGDYSGNGGKMDWGPSIYGNTTSWSAAGSGSNVRVIAIGY